jgi:ATP-dependent DNA helicase RecG
MNRLLQGDVGSGKTVVAAVAIGFAVASGAQAAIMTPTSILAEQHYASLTDLLARSPLGEGVQVALLTGATSQAERDRIYGGLASGELSVVVGTHALIQDWVRFANLGLAIIDEQHRFGVAQRGALRDKAQGGNPHLLVMTATPIPRTLALTLHADLDLTVIDEMPPGRAPVETRILYPKERERAYAFIRAQVAKGHQAFVVYPRIANGDDDADEAPEDEAAREAASAVKGYERLSTTVFPDLRCGLLHGQMRAAEKETVMEQFYRGEIDILVSTTVIEVGIDVPNATVMLVESANRFGLAQLHQLRGRVGRGGQQGYCLLISEKTFSQGDHDERLAAVEDTTDGFRLAEIDWQLRGAGDLLGTQQSGFGLATFADLMNPRLVGDVQREARALFDADPALATPDHQSLAERVAATLRARESGDIS